jgi:hypothetical protein
MKKTLAVAGLFFSLCAVSAFADSWDGVIADSMCGAKHKAGSAADAKCSQTCIKDKGASPVFVVGDNVYKIDNPDAITKHYGHKVTITGKLTGDTVHVDSVKM